MQRTILFFACILICATLVAQQYPFVNYTPREGLANNRAKFIFQDSKGKLYISTFGGLSVYDGTRFINYNKNNGLADDLVNDVVEMGEDSIWILPNTHKVHCLVKGRLKDFTPADNYTPLINQLLKSSNGNYYAISDEGLFRLEDRRFVKIALTGLPEGEVAKTLLQAVEIDKKLYILSNPDYKLPAPNLLVYDLSRDKVIAFSKTIYPFRLFSAYGKELWVSTTRGLYMLDKIDEQAKAITLKPLPDSYHIPKDLAPNFIYKDRQDNTWLASYKGVYRIKKNGETSLFTIENGLTTNIQTFIFQDDENNMWFTNEQTGLCKLSNQQLAYYPVLKPGYTVTDISIQASSDSVWFYDGPHHRVMLLLPNGRTKEWTCPDESLPCSAGFVSANGEWLLCGTSIFHWKAIPNSKHYSVTAYYKDSVNAIGFSSGLKDRNGNLVAISNKITVFSGNKIISEPIDYIADGFAIDKDNRAWVAPRNSQLFCFEISGSGNDTKLSLLRNFSKMIPGSPRSIAADQAGNIWIGTRDQGLYCLHFDGLVLRSIRQLTTLNGLSENFVNYLFCDKDNNIWAGTHSGLDKIKIDNNHFLVENITKSNNLYLPILKIQQTGKGFFWILTAAGIITYNPIRPAMNDWKPRLAFSNIVISNAGNIPMTSGRELRHFQNNLVFQLSAPTYIDEKQTRFSYLLEGSGNKNWSTPSTDASINFVNLPPGEYTLRAKAIFLHGLYPDTESSYSFTILPPWWQTWWFKSLAGLLVLGLLLSGLKYYINRKLELQRVVLEKRRAIEKERTRIATDMHDDLGAGLSRIKFLSETIGMKKQQHLPIEDEINSIRTYSHEMIDKMGEIVWALNEKNDTLSDLLSYTRAYAVEYLEQNGITCHVEEPDNLPQDIVSGEFRRNIYLTVKETLHNIVKHAQATEVLISIEITNWLILKIKDNGIGIDNTRGKPSGNGLFNMNTRIQGLNGHFEIVNSNGTQVNILVPLNL
jgi:signal transduction histidine kinase